MNNLNNLLFGLVAGASLAWVFLSLRRDSYWREFNARRQSSNPPTPPDDGELPEQVATLIPWLLEEAAQAANAGRPTAADMLALAAQLLDERGTTLTPIPVAGWEYHGDTTLAPIPVSERPWERDGFCDAEGRCWLLGKIEGDWRLINANNSGVPKLSYCFSHCLHANALPLPAAPEVKS